MLSTQYLGNLNQFEIRTVIFVLKLEVVQQELGFRIGRTLRSASIPRVRKIRVLGLPEVDVRVDDLPQRWTLVQQVLMEPALNADRRLKKKKPDELAIAKYLSPRVPNYVEAKLV